MGMLYKRGNTWWIKFYRSGRAIRESAGSTKEGDAKRLLKLREGDVERGVPLSPKVGRVRFEEAIADVVNDYKTNGKRSLPDLEQRVRDHLSPAFGGRRMAIITTADVRAYVAKRQERGAANATINRELAALKRAFTLAVQAGKLVARPHIPMLREDNARTGFFESAQFQAVLRHLPDAIKPVVIFAYITGWRVPSEVLPLQWRQVDFKGGTVRLDPGTTKNGEGRVFPLTIELRALLEAQRDASRELGMGLPRCLEKGLRGGRLPGSPPPRLQTDCDPELRGEGYLEVGGDEVDRPQNRGRLSPLCDRLRERPTRGRAPSRWRRGHNLGHNGASGRGRRRRGAV